ncbi:MAG: hypothetical protein MJ234_00620 [bacterium]|nr:hypothetical protein [bacterium]
MAYSGTESDYLKLIANRNDKKFRELFQQPFIDYEGSAKDTEKNFQDISAQMILSGAMEFAPQQIPISDEQPADKPFHEETAISYSYIQGMFVSREDKIAKRIFEKKYPIHVYGEKCIPCDYKVPVKNTRGNPEGTIDLIFSSLSYAIPEFLGFSQDEEIPEIEDPFCRYVSAIKKLMKKASKSIVLAKLHSSESDCGLLKAALELETAFRKTPWDRLRNCYDRQRIKKALILFDGSRSFNEYFSFEFRETKKLIDDWKIAIITARELYGDTEPDFNEYALSSITHIYSSYKL